MKAKKPLCPKCEKPMKLISTGYRFETYHYESCKTNIQMERKK
jgi:tRNA(Ile2) C34 agmatinyltransferase TiaS